MPDQSHVPKSAAVIGGGPAGLMAAEVLSHAGIAVTVYDRMPSVGRKFLLAGRGGLNLTHSEEIERFLSRYGAASAHLRKAIADFSPADLRAWSEKLGQTTFIGSSGRVFPVAMKSSPLLRAWLRRLAAAGVTFVMNQRWTGWDGEGLAFVDRDGVATRVAADVTVLALGGASWPRLGSDGSWVDALAREGIAVQKLQSANCGFIVEWSELFRNRFEGQPLKRLSLSFGGETIRGEAVVARYGLEGGAVYALSGPLREAISSHGHATLTVDLRPDMTQKELAARVSYPRNKSSLSNFLRKTTNLSPTAIGLAQEAAAGKLANMTPAAMAGLIKAIPLRLTGLAPIVRAISTAGGISFDEVDDNFMLARKPGVFVAGEMLDWEAPTGGYLLQASFATGAAAGRGALAWLGRGKSA